ncbi:MAG: hypothetical protein NTV00_15915 [Methylococcales bacterium]|nr:hypothetical protein [Methylococcales bacterium]
MIRKGFLYRLGVKHVAAGIRGQPVIYDVAANCSQVIFMLYKELIMSIFKSVVLGALLTAPMLVGATTTTSYSSSTSPSSSYTGNGTGQLDKDYSLTGFSDSWTLNVGSGDVATLTFSPTTLSQRGASLLSLDGFSVNGETGNFFKAGITAGIYNFSVASTAASGLFGGTYTGTTTVASAVSAVPVPAAVWFMGSAMVGLFSFRKRKVTLVA